jgi:hypothetical protein
MNRINAMIITTEGRLKTMNNMVLENDYKRVLAKEGIFYYNNMLRCIGCYTVLKKVNTKHLKRHTFSDNCITSTSVLMNNEVLRKKSFTQFKTARRHFKKILVVAMLARRGFYSFGKSNYIRCSYCLVSFKYVSVESAQQQHTVECVFVNAIDEQKEDNASDDEYPINEKQIFQANFPPPESFSKLIPSAPVLSDNYVECKICFDKERSVCFMPCRHLYTCKECSRRCKKCCICNAKIDKYISTITQ